MKVLFLQCNMGIAGDMFCASLLDTMPNEEKEKVLSVANSFIDGVSVSLTSDEKCGIVGSKFNVLIEKGNWQHSNLSQIYDVIDSFNIDEKSKADAKAVYSIIANAESEAHGLPVCDVHFHEVGAKDAIVDVATACYIVNYLGINKIVCTPITTGFGSAKTAHGIMPVPAPATANILRGLSIKTGDIEGELCTPTGSALVKYFADEITNDVAFSPIAVGYGMGAKNFEKPNCLRAVIGNSSDEFVYELRCQVDDMTGEQCGFAIEKFISLGALDAFVKPIVMKKSRPAFEFVVITTPDKKDYFTQQMFKHTTSLGIRQVKCIRSAMQRQIVECGAVHIKKSTGYGVEKQKIEFDDLAKIANEKDISIFEALESI